MEDSTNRETIPSNSQIKKEQFEQEKEICSLYIDCAKTYIQLSTGALLLSLTFYDDIIGTKDFDFLRNWPLVVIWALWLIIILFGVTYQYFVTKYLEDIADENGLLYFKRTWKLMIPQLLRDNPYILYGIMSILFYLSVLLFSILLFVEIIRH